MSSSTICAFLPRTCRWAWALASHGAQTGAMLSAIEPVLQQQAPDWVLVYGDTNSTLAGASGCGEATSAVAHLEAGLRSFNRGMPEEHNRVLTDHAADLLLAPTQVAFEHLRAEGLACPHGDGWRRDGRRVPSSGPCRRQPGQSSRRSTVICVRASSWLPPCIGRRTPTTRRGCAYLWQALKALPTPVVLPVHPRLRDRAAAAGIELYGGPLVPIAPLSYPDMVLLVSRSRAVVTDSGGLQKEAYVLGAPCTTLRTETEWVETLTDGWNVLVPDAESLSTVALRGKPSAARPPHYGTGRAAAEVIAALR